MTNLYIIAIELFVVIPAMLAALILSLKKTYYSFRSTMLIAGIVFCTVSIISLIAAGTGLEKLISERIGIFSSGRIKDIEEVTGFLWVLEYSRIFIRITLWIMIAMSILMAVSNIALIKHEGKRVKNVYGTLLGLFFVLGALFLLSAEKLVTGFLLNYMSAEEAVAAGEAVKSAAGISGGSELLTEVFFGFLLPFAYSALCYFECVTAGIAIMGWIAARQKPKYDKDYIIILGCLISKSGGLLPLLRERTNRAIKYAWEQEIATGKPVMYVPSGGQGPGEIMSEGSAMALYLESHGAEENEVMAEKKSRNTWENFVFSRKLILEKKPDAKAAFATTNYHILRSGMLARRAGFKDIEAISSKTRWYFWPNGFAREIIAIFAMTWRVHAVSLCILAAVCIAGL
ncbi:MAG: YdcF family protein [Eubacteriales bacterium]|nr:YdcF family protein [Eubacteriales bacterium]